MSKWRWVYSQINKKLWLRSTLFCVLAVIATLLAYFVEGVLPDGLSEAIGASSVDRILNILASSMLAVTTFSLSTMVAAFSAATSNVTPHSTQLLLEDTTAQTALSVFIGAFLYALTGLIFLSIGLYGDDGRVVLFLFTLTVVLVIVVVLVRWINYLSVLGRMSHTIQKVEKATQRSIQTRLETPFLGGYCLEAFAVQPHHWPITPQALGYIQYIDVTALQKIGENCGVDFYLQKLPGEYSDGLRPVIYCSKILDDQDFHRACEAFVIGDCRSYEQDPRYGLRVLSEIASRALSPAVNDPGTACDILSTGLRVLMPWFIADDMPMDVVCPRVFVPQLEISVLMRDFYAPIIRDGKALFEVMSDILQHLRTIHDLGLKYRDDGVVLAALSLKSLAVETLAKTHMVDTERNTLLVMTNWDLK